ncbi:MAG: S8 family serine peptidase [Planctomycetia bacterium]
MPVSPGNAGRDAGLAGAWAAGWTGNGVTIGILDDGTQGDHPDLRDAFQNDLSWDFGRSAAANRASLLRGAPVKNAKGKAGDNHGTPVAGVAAARGGNGIGTTGAAPKAGIAALRTLGGTARGHTPDAAEAAAIRYQGQTNRAGRPDPYAPVNWSAGVPVRVKNHSYGEDYPFLASQRGTVVPALAESAAHGVIHVFAAGNQRTDYPTADSNKIERNANPNTITVAALGSDGRYASYSSYGANVFVTAPSRSDTPGTFAIATTDRTTLELGDNLDSTDVDPYLVYADDMSGNYTSSFGGTSSAAPLVAGIMALGVEANPDLNVRMAKHLLTTTSVKVDDANPSWTTNAAGLTFSQDYGFGLINADAFTQAATRVVSLSEAESFRSPAVRVGKRFTPSQTVLTATYTVPETAVTMPMESLRVTLNVGELQTDLGRYRNGLGAGRGAISGDLEAFVTSPAGTRYRLFSDDRFLVCTDDQNNRYGGKDGPRPQATLNWTFMSNAYWGESAAGTWMIELANKAAASQLRGRSGLWRSVSFQFDTGMIDFGTRPTAASASARGRDQGPAATPLPAATGDIFRWLAAHTLESGTRELSPSGDTFGRTSRRNRG